MHTKSWSENQKGGDHLDEFYRRRKGNGKIDLQGIWRKSEDWVLLPRKEPTGWFLLNTANLSSFIKYGEFLEKLTDYRLIKKDSTA
jgi:hypothetical protein